MSGFGNFLAGAVSAGGSAVASVANRYIDDEIARNRQQAFLDMQRASNLQQTKDIDAYQNDPARRENLRNLKSQDDAAAAASALSADKARLGDKEYQALALENQRGQARVAGEVATEQTIANGKNKDYLDSVRAVKLADPEIQARLAQARAQLGTSAAHTRLLNLQGDEAEMALKDRKAINGLLDTYDATLNDKSIDDKTRGERLTRLTQQLNVIRARNGKAGSDETDTVKITDEQSLPGGGTRKTERTEKRKAGTTPAGDKADPFGILPALQAGKAKQTEPAGTRPPEATAAPVFNPTSREDNVLQASIAPKVDAYRAADQAYRQVLQSSPGDQQALAAALEKRRDAYLQVEDFARSMFARNPKNPTLPEQKRLSEFFKSLN